ncbi:MAG: hypothetical protein FGM18_07335 [Burkholderiaceae bacterium]|nr:hypothetical protein [Burkholderiaceae bacterium]
MCFATLLALTAGAALASESVQGFVAGLAPYERPESAPRLTQATPESVRADKATYGIEGSVPDSIQRFLKDQGGWHTPFSWPGMTGPYDIRGWHRQHTGKK